MKKKEIFPFSISQITDYKHTPLIKKIADILHGRMEHKGNDEHFYSLYAYYYLASIASDLHITYCLHGEKRHPNTSFIAIADSGEGKGMANRYLESNLYEPFLEQYREFIEDIRLERLNDYQEKYNKSDKEVHALLDKVLKTNDGRVGDITHAAMNQRINKIKILQTYGFNVFLDEFGSHFDTIKDSILKNINELADGKFVHKDTLNCDTNQSYPVPNNKIPFVSLFMGSPPKILDNTQTFSEFMNILRSGLARRSIYACFSGESYELTVEQKKKINRFVTESNSFTELKEFAQNVAKLKYYKKVYNFNEESEDLIDAHAVACINLGSASKGTSANLNYMRGSAEIIIRNLACISAFSRESDGIIEVQDVRSAIKLFEHSIHSFEALENRPPLYELLAERLANSRRGDVQSVLDIERNYGSLLKGEPRVKDTITKAIETLINKPGVSVSVHQIETISGGKFKTKDCYEIFKQEPTDLNAIPYSIGEAGANSQGTFNSLSGGSGCNFIKFSELEKVLTVNQPIKVWSPFNWLNNVQVSQKTNLLVFNTVDKPSFKYLNAVFSKFKYFIHTTKSWNGEEGNFRIVLPLRYTLDLSSEEYRNLYFSIMSFVPIELETMDNNLWYTTPYGGYLTHADSYLGYNPDTGEWNEKQIVWTKSAYNDNSNAELFDGYEFLNSTSTDSTNTSKLVNRREINLKKYETLDPVAQWVLWTYSFNTSLGIIILQKYIELKKAVPNYSIAALMTEANRLGNLMTPIVSSQEINKMLNKEA